MGARLRTSVLALVGVLALAGCGEEQVTPPPPPPPPQEQVADAAELMFTATDPQGCTTVYTEAALAQLVGTADPLAACREQLPATEPASSVLVEQVEVADQRAKALATPDGGDYDGLAVDLVLVQADGSWRVDGISDLELLDRDVVLSPIHDGVQQFVGDSLRPEDSDCIDALIDRIDDEEVERLILERQMGQRGVDAMRQCLGAGQDLLTMFALLNNQLLNAGASESSAACVAGYMTGFFQDWTIEEAMTDPSYGKKRDAEILRVVDEYCTN